MTRKKTHQEREKELRLLLGTPAGRAKRDALASPSCAASGKFRPARASAITDILVHEKEHGLIADQDIPVRRAARAAAAVRRLSWLSLAARSQDGASASPTGS
jgi:hypothetical protein